MEEEEKEMREKGRGRRTELYHLEVPRVVQAISPFLIFGFLEEKCSIIFSEEEETGQDGRRRAKAEGVVVVVEAEIVEGGASAKDLRHALIASLGESLLPNSQNE